MCILTINTIKSKTREIWVRSVNSINFNILVVILYHSLAKWYLWRKLGKVSKEFSVLFFTAECESTTSSIQFLQKGPRSLKQTLQLRDSIDHTGAPDPTHPRPSSSTYLLAEPWQSRHRVWVELECRKSCPVEAHETIILSHPIFSSTNDLSDAMRSMKSTNGP